MNTSTTQIARNTWSHHSAAAEPTWADRLAFGDAPLWMLATAALAASVLLAAFVVVLQNGMARGEALRAQQRAWASATQLQPMTAPQSLGFLAPVSPMQTTTLADAR